MQKKEKNISEAIIPNCPPLKILQGQKALVTGAGSGIGRSVATALAAAGADVVINYISDKDPIKEIVSKIQQSDSKVFAYKADITNEIQVKDMFQAMFDRFGTIDILVNNAGIEKDAPIDKILLKDWKKVIDVNITGQFLCSREAIIEFKRRGVVKDISCAAGKIIFMSSVHQVIPWTNHVAYATSKAGEMMMMKSIAQEVAQYRIRVNSIAPGAIRTPINEKVWESPEGKKKLLSLIPYGRIGEPEDIARIAVWLASDQADYITGATIFADGGMTLYPGFTTGG